MKSNSEQINEAGHMLGLRVVLAYPAAPLIRMQPALACAMLIGKRAYAHFNGGRKS
jgi:hypothetical protein